MTATPLVLFGAAAQRIPLSMLGLLQYLTPVIQFVLGVFVLSEDMPAERWAGFAIVWLGLILLTIDAASRRDSGPATIGVGACRCRNSIVRSHASVDVGSWLTPAGLSSANQ